MSQASSPSRQIKVLGPLRHRCLCCGRACHGVNVWLTDAEQVRLRDFGSRLGLGEVVQDGRLLFPGGSCVFLGSDRLCRVHQQAGADAKPLVCRQYPLVVIRTEQELRAGVDPSCYETWQTWRTVPPLPIEAAAVEKTYFSPALARMEDAWLDVLSRRDLHLGLLGAILSGQPKGRRGGRLPPDSLRSRLVERLQEARLASLLAQAPIGPALRSTLDPVVRAIASWSAADPPAWPAPGRLQEEYVVEVSRRMLYLRLGSSLPDPGCVLVTLWVGAMACAWTDPRPEVFGPALSAWSRIMRERAFWASIFADAMAVEIFLKG